MTTLKFGDVLDLAGTKQEVRDGTPRSRRAA
jgi:hypothetical protein